MSGITFTATYAPSAGPLRLGHSGNVPDTDRPATRGDPRPRHSWRRVRVASHRYPRVQPADGPVPR